MRLRGLACVMALLLVVACDGNKPGTNSPDGDDPGSRMEGREGDVATAAPKVEGEQATAEQKVRPSVQDRDPEEEKRKMAKSRKQSAAARNLLDKGRVDEAIKASREALRIHEQNVDAMLVIAEAYFRQRKWEITLAVCTSALAVDAKIRTPSETSRIHNLRAFAYAKMGKENLATESFREAAQSDEKNAAAWNNLGTRYLAAGDTKTALGCFEYALELDPKFAKAHVNYGAALRANGQLEQAEKSFIKALQLQPNFAAAYFNLGVLYLDAEPFPGLDTSQRLNKAIEFLGKYKQYAGPTVVEGKAPKNKGADPVSKDRADDYIRVAQKGLKSEDRRKEREARRASKGTSDDGVTDATGGGGGDGGGDAGDAGDGGGDDAGDVTPAGGDEPDAPTPTPTQPTPTPTPVQPTKPGQPTQPAKPSPTPPAKPTPVEPTKPAPTEPAKPAPTQPAKPTQPAPTQPAPVQPKPVQPKPVQPTPVQPTPVKPVQPK